MLNVEEDLRRKEIPMQEVGLFDPQRDDVEPIPFVHPNLTAVRKIKLKAEKAKLKFLQESTSPSGNYYFADGEYNEAIKYWTVVFSLSIDDEAAYIINGQKCVEQYIENKLGSKFNGVYDELALSIIDEVGLELKELDREEQAEEVPHLITAAG